MNASRHVIVPRSKGAMKVFFYTFLLLAIYAILLASTINVSDFWEKNFPLGFAGLRATAVASLLVTACYLPNVWVFWHLATIMEEARVAKRSWLLYLIAGEAFCKGLLKSQLIVFGGFIYFILLMAGWIAYTAIAGI